MSGVSCAKLKVYDFVICNLYRESKWWVDFLFLKKENWRSCGTGLSFMGEDSNTQLENTCGEREEREMRESERCGGMWGEANEDCSGSCFSRECITVLVWLHVFNVRHISHNYHYCNAKTILWCEKNIIQILKYLCIMLVFTTILYWNKVYYSNFTVWGL